MSIINLLLVEDDVMDQMSFQRFVKQQGLNYHYQIASSLNEAIKLLSNHIFDIVLADHALGDGTAFDLFAYIPRQTPIIFITGSGNEKIAVNALKAGAADYLTKDIGANYLKLLPITIENVLTAQSEKNELELYRTQLEALVEQRTAALKHEIEKRKQVEKQLRLLAITFEIHESIVITDAQGIIIRVNKAFTQLTGYTAEECTGKNMSIMKSGHQDSAFYIAMWTQLVQTGKFEGEIWNRAKSGKVYPEYLTITAVKDDEGKVSNYVGLLTDITLQKEAELKIKKLAFYDALTSLANRRLLIDRLEHEIVISKRTSFYGSILFLDLDEFKALNDTYGHYVGDELLIQVALRLQLVLREEDTPARLGGDEFVVLIHATDNNHNIALTNAKIVARKIQNELNKPYLIENKEHYFSCSIGITVFPEKNKTANDMLQQADKAMYHSKQAGKDAISYYDISSSSSILI